MTLRFKAAATAAAASVALLCAVAAPAMAQPTTDPAAVQGGAYAVEPNHTQVLFRVMHLGFTNYYGVFSGASGAMMLDPRNPSASSLQVSIPIASVHTTSTVLDGELKSPTWFDAAKYPTAEFRSTGVHVTGPGQADVMGELTLHGVTQPITLHAKLSGAGPNPMNKHYTVGFDATGEIQRSQFGVKTYVPMVGDQVKLIISGAFEKKGS